MLCKYKNIPYTLFLAGFNRAEAVIMWCEVNYSTFNITLSDRASYVCIMAPYALTLRLRLRQTYFICYA
jgi:hypothetical protein